MLKKSVIAMCLCVTAWAGTCQASFLGNNQDLQFLRDINSANKPAQNSGAPVGGNTASDTGQAATQDQPAQPQYPAGDLTIALDTTGDAQNPVITATVPEPGALELVALGLVILGSRAYFRRRIRA